MEGSARKDVVFGAARAYTVTVPGPKWKFWIKEAALLLALCGAACGNASQRPAIDEYFSPDYSAARTRFRSAVSKTGGGLTSLGLSAKGPDGEDLTIDIAWFGVEKPRRAFIHSSGLHGVEAFAGSAISCSGWMKACLRRQRTSRSSWRTF